MPNTIHCPSCQRELRVPAELVGKKVKCPSCGVIFTAGLEPEAPPEPPVVLAEAESPPEPASPPPTRPLPREEEYYREPTQDDYARQAWERRLSRERGLAALRAPAICLLITGVIGFLATAWFLINTVVQTEEAIQQQMPPAADPQEREMQQKVIKLFLSPGMKLFNLASMAGNLMVILSAIMMLIGKARWLAYLGSIVAMINVDCCCCLPGAGFGIWALITLSKPEVQAIFD